MKNIFLLGGFFGLAALATACGPTRPVVVVPVVPQPVIVRPAPIVVRPPIIVAPRPVIVQPRGVIVRTRTTTVPVNPATTTVRKTAQPAQPVQRAPGN
jgi:hypothetical protein